MASPAPNELSPMHRAPRLDRDRSLLLIVDVQERLAPHVQDHEALIARCEALLAAARLFAIPVLATEHCPGEIGALVPRLRSRLAEGEVFRKTFFGAADHAEFGALLASRGRTQIVVAGMEAHVCVMQTALGLAAQEREIFPVADALGSRPQRQLDRALALERMRAAGCTTTATETVLFEWTRAGYDRAFAEVLALVKALP